MFDRNKRRHPLETFLSNIDQDNSKQSPEVSVGIQLGYDYVNLRGDPSNSNFVSAAENALNQSIPLAPNTISEDIGKELENEDFIISANNEKAFIFACSDGHLELAKWLLELKPDLSLIHI